MPSAGYINIALTLDNQSSITAVSIANHRPINIGQLLKGKTPPQAIALIPAIYMLCSQAQQSAALGAILAAQNSELSEAQHHRIYTGCALEWLKEHSWQLWQMERELFGDDFALQPSIAVSRLLIKELNQLEKLTLNLHSSHQQPNWETIQRSFIPLFGITTAQFLDLNMKGLSIWAQSDAPYAQLFSKMLDEEVVQFGAFSRWQDKIESSSIVRQKKHPLVSDAITLWGSSIATRTLARFIEIASVCKQPQLTSPLKQGEALSSRGVLNHQVTIDEHGIITRYDIDAPTDRYFKQQGLVVDSLFGQRVKNVKWVRQLIWAIDPCVEFSVHIDQEFTED